MGWNRFLSSILILNSLCLDYNNVVGSWHVVSASTNPIVITIVYIVFWNPVYITGYRMGWNRFLSSILILNSLCLDYNNVVTFQIDFCLLSILIPPIFFYRNSICFRMLLQNDFVFVVCDFAGGGGNLSLFNGKQLTKKGLFFQL